jgi:hypothetical protein
MHLKPYGGGTVRLATPNSVAPTTILFDILCSV